MFCINCMSTVSECGNDIYITDDDNVVEETQYECDSQCSGRILSLAVIVGVGYDFRGLGLTPQDKERLAMLWCGQLS